MPLAKFEVRNEYGLGQPELYRNVDPEDPKAVLDGVAVSGLVGILRQLGDLAEFAAELFHGIQEEVMITASRSNGLMIRLQHIEAAVPSLEKAALAQTSHIHFAYTAGREWHPHIPNGQNHFIYNDLPRFIMDSYEECRDPPRLHLLDKFDIDGPGSCLKRYSDPTYFRRASGRLIEANNKIQKDKKNRKIKRKKSSQRNRDISRLASMANQSSRRQFTSFSFSGRTSSSRTASTIDMGFKSDLQDRSRSFDSGSGSGVIERISNVASSAKTEEKPPRISSSSSLTQRAFTIASVLSDCQSDADDNFPCNPSREQTARGSSCTSWDEKAEIVESNGLKCATDEAPEAMETSFVMDAPDGKTTVEGRTGGVDFHSNDIETAEPVSSLQQLNGLEAERDIKTGREIEREPGLGKELEMDSEHETESEGDNYVDALNTIESESENDLGFRSSRELQKTSSEINNEGLEKALFMHDCARPCPTEPDTEQNSNNVEDGRSADGLIDHRLRNDETTCTASNVHTNERISLSLQEPESSVNASDELIPQVSAVASDMNNSPGNDLCASGYTHDKSKGEYYMTFPSVSASGDNLSCSSNPLYINSMQEHQESEAETSQDVQPVKIWTNGSLLGLEPSKPPVFAVPSSLTQDSKAGDGMIPSCDAQKENSDKLVENAQWFQRVPSSATEKVCQPFADPHAEHEISGNSNQTSANGTALTNLSVVTSEAEHPVRSDIKAIHAGAQQENHETLSGVFGLSHRLIMNGFRRKDLLAHDRKIVPATIPENTELTEKGEFCGQAIEEKTFKDAPFDETPFDWLTSSPPLEHMKISFNPADSLQISKLKLTFPDGVKCREGNKYTFSSFQLVPEPAATLADTDSDDDTFCRSYPGTSDNDYLSENCSVSNSEQWEESTDSPERKDQEPYDSLQRDAQSENATEPSSLSTPLLDVPSFETLKPSLQIETVNNSVSGNLSYLQNPAEPSPPPLPPAQWRVSKISADGFEDKQQSLQDALRHAFDQKLSLSTGSQQSFIVAPVNKELPNVVSTEPKPENNVHPKNNQREDKQNANRKETDTGDFLHQIRTKQFNLRRTVTTRPSAAAATGPPTNININAILEKANSIRQAVASDDGDETDTWSDT